MTPSPGIEPGPHWWEASALTTAPRYQLTYNAGPLQAKQNILCFRLTHSKETQKKKENKTLICEENGPSELPQFSE